MTIVFRGIDFSYEIRTHKGGRPFFVNHQVLLQSLDRLQPNVTLVEILGGMIYRQLQEVR